jgi:hypothetical protein
MIRLAITMTIETKLETFSSAKDRGFRYVRSGSVAVVSVTAEREVDDSLPAALKACVHRFQATLQGWLRELPLYRVLLFVARPFRLHHNVLARRRGVWGVDALRWLPTNVRRSPSVEIHERNAGSRFAGLADVGEANFLRAAECARTERASFLLMSARTDLTEERVRSIVTYASPGARSDVDWEGVVAQVEDGAEICIRVSGGFDDKTVSIDAFLHEDLLRKLATD